MKKITVQKGCIVALLAIFMLSGSNLALAEKPSWAGSKNKHEKHWKKKKKYHDRDYDDSYSHDRYRSGAHVSVYFGGRHRDVIRDYYRSSYRRGHCPPGLAKKNNRCMPPGQYKKWRIGRPLSRDVIFHDLPYEVTVRLGRPPEGHRFVRVASDILLIAVGTGMVIDAIDDLSNL